ncbi:MAG: UbiH/UbiF/VisC/COQ6 family ubiquinone biosynthesis hydroxylase [Bdellovibrionales bacterium]
MPRQNPTHIADCVIVGGGLAGLSTACLLGAHGMNIICIDQLDPARQPRDLRTTAISYGSAKVLERAGVWADMQDKACPIENIEIFDGDSPLLLNFLSEEVGGQPFGWIVDNAEFKDVLIAKLARLQNVTHIAPAAVGGFDVQDDHASVTLADGRILRGKLVIGADGRGSTMREFMDVETRQWSYNQRAVICCIGHENPHHNAAVEHFWPQGPFAVLPMHDDAGGTHRSSIVFTEHGPKRRSLMRLSDQEFETALAARMPPRYGAITVLNKRACYPLNLIHAASYIAPRMALIADAAHGIHPIAGQGLNLGFRDIGALGDLLIAAHNNGDDVGNDTLLTAYQRARRFDNMTMAGVTDGLVRLFSNNNPGVRIIRRTGLKLVSRLKPAKQFFMKQAMGDR